MTTGSRTEGVRGIGSNGFIRTVGNLTVTGDLVVLGENRALAGTGSFFWEVADGNAEYWAFELPTGTSEQVPVLGVGVGLDGVDLGLFDGITQPTVAVIDADRDSFIAMDFSADDAGRLRSNTTINITPTGALSVGTDGTGNDVIFYSGTSGDNLTWDASEEVLQITGTNGATALDVLDGDVRIVDTLYFFDRGGEYMSSDGSTLAIVGNTSVTGNLTVDGDLGFTGPQEITTSSGALTLDPTTYVVVPVNKEIVQGYTAPIVVNTESNLGAATPSVTVAQADDATMVLANFSSSSARGPSFVFLRSGHNTIGSNTRVDDGESLGGIVWAAADGSDFLSRSAQITVQIDGSTDTNDVPGRILFMTTPDGSEAPVERMRLDSTGFLSLRTSVDTAIVADVVGFSRYEIGAGNTVLGISQETAVATDVDETKFSHKMQVRINGATYFLMLTAT